MNNLEKFIEHNRGDFDSEEPNPGHFNRFKARVYYKKPSWPDILKIAAAIFVGVLISGAIYQFSEEFEPESRAAINTVLPVEFLEARYFYETEINSRLEFLKDTKRNNNISVETILQDINDMDASLQTLRTELLQSPGDERIMNTIIMHYKIKLEILDDVISGLQSKQDTPAPVRENIEIS